MQWDRVLWFYLEDNEDDYKSLVEAIKYAEFDPPVDVLWFEKPEAFSDEIDKILKTQDKDPSENLIQKVIATKGKEYTVKFRELNGIIESNIECYIFDVILRDSSKSYPYVARWAKLLHENRRVDMLRPIYFLTDSSAQDSKPSLIGEGDHELLTVKSMFIPKSKELYEIDRTTHPLELEDEESDDEPDFLPIVTKIRNINKSGRNEIHRWLASMGANTALRKRISILLYGDLHYGKMSRTLPFYSAEGLGKKQDDTYYLQNEFLKYLEDISTRIKYGKGIGSRLTIHELQNLDLTICVGDITSEGVQEHVKLFSDEMLNKLAEDTKLEINNGLHLVVPGNHDFVRNANSNEEKVKNKENFYNKIYNFVRVGGEQTLNKTILSPVGIKFPVTNGSQVKNRIDFSSNKSQLQLMDVWSEGDINMPVSLSLFRVNGIPSVGIIILMLDIYAYPSITKKIASKKEEIQEDYPIGYDQKYGIIVEGAIRKATYCWTKNESETIRSLLKNTLKLAVLHQPFSNINSLSSDQRRNGTMVGQDDLLNILEENCFQGIVCGHAHVSHLEKTNNASKNMFTALAPSIAAYDCVHRLGYSVLQLDLPVCDLKKKPVRVNQITRYINKWGLTYENNSKKEKENSLDIYCN